MTSLKRPSTRRPQPRRWCLAIITAAFAYVPVAAAQSAGLAAAVEAFERAQQSSVDATPDVPAWSAAIDAAERAVAEAVTPEAKEQALRQLARTFQAVAWWVRAEATWTELEAEQGGLAEGDLNARAEVRTQLAYARFEQGDLVAARGFVDQALNDAPQSLPARRLQARLDLEQGRRADALRRFRALAVELPDDEEVAHALRIIQERERWGLTASDAYRRGLRLRAENDWRASQQAFKEAAAAAPQWGAPAVSLVQTALEAGDIQAAGRHLAAMETRLPDHPDQHRLVQTVRHARQVGTQAALAYQAALAEYDAGNVSEAIERLTVLAAEEPMWVAPWAQVGQIHFNRSAWRDAAEAFERALQRAPGDATLTFFFEQSRMLAGSQSP